MLLKHFNFTLNFFSNIRTSYLFNLIFNVSFSRKFISDTHKSQFYNITPVLIYSIILRKRQWETFLLVNVVNKKQTAAKYVNV